MSTLETRIATELYTYMKQADDIDINEEVDKADKIKEVKDKFPEIMDAILNKKNGEAVNKIRMWAGTKALENLDRVNQAGYNMLLSAVSNNLPDVVEILLEKGASKDVMVRGKSAVDIAKSKHFNRVLEILEQY